MFVKAILCIRVARGSLPPPGALRPGRLFFAAPALYPSAPDFFAAPPGSRPRLPQYMAAYESLTFKLIYNYILPIYVDRRNSTSDIKQPIPQGHILEPSTTIFLSKPHPRPGPANVHRCQRHRAKPVFCIPFPCFNMNMGGAFGEGGVNLPKILANLPLPV